MYYISTFNSYIHNISQIEGTNKLKVTIKSMSNIDYPNIYKYYLLINLNYHSNSSAYYQVVYNQKIINSSKKQALFIVEDDGLNEFFECEIEVNIGLNEYSSNSMSLIALRKEDNLIIYTYKEEIFVYKNIPKNIDDDDVDDDDDSNAIYFIIGGGVLLIIIILIVVLIVLRRRKKNNIDINDKNNSLGEGLYKMEEK